MCKGWRYRVWHFWQAELLGPFRKHDCWCGWGPGNSFKVFEGKLCHFPWKCLLFLLSCCVLHWWNDEATTLPSTRKIQLSHSVHYAWFQFGLLNTHTNTFWWATLWSFNPQLNILVPDLRFALLPWQHKCYAVMSIIGWEWGECGVKPHDHLCVLAFVFGDHPQSLLLLFMWV